MTYQAWVEWPQTLIYNWILRFDVQDTSSTKDVPLQLKLKWQGQVRVLMTPTSPKLHDHLAFKLSWRSPGRHPPDRSPLHGVHRKTNMLPNFKNSKFKTPFHLPQPLSTEMYHDALLGLARWWKPKSILHLSAFYSRPSASYLRPSASHPSPSSCRSRKSTSTILFMIRTLYFCTLWL